MPSAVRQNKKKFKNQLKKKSDKSYKTKDMRPTSYLNFIKPEYRTKELPFNDATHVFDIIPFVPEISIANLVAGENEYMLDVWIHRNIGPKGQQILCPEWNNNLGIGDVCPVCRYMKKLREQGADYETEIKPLKLSRRTVYNVWVHTRGSDHKGKVLILEAAHFFIEEKLQAAKTNPLDGGTIEYMDPDEGKVITCIRSTRGENVTVTGHAFLDRRGDLYEMVDGVPIIPDAILDKAIDLSKIPLVFTAEEIDEMLFREEQPHSSVRPNAPAPDDDNDTPQDSGTDDDEPSRESPAPDPEPEPSSSSGGDDGEITWDTIKDMDMDAMDQFCDDNGIDLYAQDFDGQDDAENKMRRALAEQLQIEAPTAAPARRRRR